MKRTMFAVMVKPSCRSKVCLRGKSWVKDSSYEFYVSKAERGLWETREEAEKAITEPYEVVVEVKV